MMMTGDRGFNCDDDLLVDLERAGKQSDPQR